MSRTKKSTPALKAIGLTKSSGIGADSKRMLEDVSLSIYPGELVALRGFSSAATAALFTCLSGLDVPDSGSVFIGDLELTAMRESDRAELRRTELGLVSGSCSLVPFLSVSENIEAPLRLVGMAPADREVRVRELLEFVGLAGNQHQQPSGLSAAQQLRVTLARALANQPKLLLAVPVNEKGDGPAAEELTNLVSSLVDETEVAAIVWTSDSLLLGRADRVHELRDGRMSVPVSVRACTAVSSSNASLSGSQMIEVPAEIADQRRQKG